MYLWNYALFLIWGDMIEVFLWNTFTKFFKGNEGVKFVMYKLNEFWDSQIVDRGEPFNEKKWLISEIEGRVVLAVNVDLYDIAVR